MRRVRRRRNGRALAGGRACGTPPTHALNVPLCCMGRRKFGMEDEKPEFPGIPDLGKTMTGNLDTDFPKL